MKQYTKSFNYIPIFQLNKADRINIAVITFTWAFIIVLVNPIGDFPLNDDWAYARSVKFLLETGNFQLPGWAVANLLPQALWGAMFCLPFGFSFTALRFSTLVLGWIGVVVTYLVLKEFCPHQKLAFIGTLLIAINPIYFSLANSFMTDVPHYAVTMLSLYFYVIGIKKKSLPIVIIALFIAIISFLIRQLTVALFAGYAIAYIVHNKAKISSIVTAALLFLIVPIGTHKVFSEIFWPNFGNYGVKEQEAVSQLTYVNLEAITSFAYFALCTLLYLGCFLLPIAILVFSVKLKRAKTSFAKNLLISLFLFISTIIGVWLAMKGEKMPIRGNLLIDWGLGPLTLRSTILSSSPIPNNLEFFWFLVTIIAAVGAGLLLLFIVLSIVEFLFNRTDKTEKKSLILLNNSTAFIYFLPLGLGYFFDRYLILLLPLTIVMVLTAISKVNDFKLDLKTNLIVLASIASIGIFTVGITHDYLSWNRVRWQALNDLMQQDITPNRIDGGFEFNGWYLYDPEYPIYSRRGKDVPWWWVEEEDYVVDFNKIAGYDVVKQYPLKNWFPFLSNRIFVLQKSST